ncbi:uncharacterized protein LOC120269511 [Dioscorea cayenensis subsp. rotundata]|uniref:Uncharacterized protein LOC120269511 n=1 Tax=Dioscorea cayennensis subsp. rotundata TaxID=55577 RepID=A0AB40C2X3_DIOCR|nr:uncharacterized protein LOC120269511 [Dioscorea cayenensis subsp. rotundata]
MSPSQPARINLSDLKSQIWRKLGPERSQRYFSFLNRFLFRKLGASEFKKLCFLTFGRENIHLHNKLISGILRNAHYSKCPPPLKPPVSLGKNLRKKDDAFSPSLAPTPPNQVWSNGDILPPSPRKVRSAIRDRRIKDRPSHLLGPNGRTDMGASQSLALADEFGVRANGSLVLSSSKSPVVQHQHDSAAEQQVKRQQKLNLVPDDQAPVHDKDLVETVSQEDGAEMSNGLNSRCDPLKAPLGIPFCPASVGGARRSLPLVTGSGISGYCSGCGSGELCDTEILRRRMEKIAEVHGLEGVSMDCANLLNNGVDVYLKRLIKSCIELVGVRSRHDRLNHSLLKQRSYANAVNGVWRGNHLHVQSDHMPLNAINQLKNHRSISLQDFKVAMELNPKQVGEDYPLLLEEICFHSFEE